MSLFVNGFGFARLLAISTGIAGAVVAVVAQTPPATGPRVVVAKLTHDFGVVGLGTEPAVNIAVQNTGTAPLDVNIAAQPPGLRIVSLDKTIAPKGAGTLRVAVDTFRAAPTNDWRLTLTTSDPQKPEVEIALTATVRIFLAVDPPSARFTFVQFGKEGGTTHTLAAVDAPKLQVTSVESPFDYITATFRELKANERSADLPAGRQWGISLRIAARAPVGPIGGFVVVHTNHPKQPNAFIEVTGFVRPLFAVTPTAVDFREVKVSAVSPATRSLVVKNFGAEELQLTSATSDLSGLEATIVPVEAGHSWRVDLKLGPGTGPLTASPFKATLRLKTTSTNVPELIVPLQGTRIVEAAAAR